MGLTELTALVSLIAALSIASERLVEIIKGLVPSLDLQKKDLKEEGRRRALLQILAVASGIVTALLARDYVPTQLSDPSKGWSILGLGLLASGGSGFWNSILTYLLKVKDAAKYDAGIKKNALEISNITTSIEKKRLLSN
jgi:hypothetical protein